MIRTGAEEFGDPCTQCGYVWIQTFDEIVRDHARIHSDLGAAVTADTSGLRAVDAKWSVGEYVCHIADNERIWSERLASLAVMAKPRIASFDQDLLAEARNYPQIPYETAVWSLDHAYAELSRAVEQRNGTGVEFEHPERGSLMLIDATRMVIHDCHHHLWDIQRILAQR